jgi:transcriptional regulator with PAS, ATPase and Fis domain
VKSFRDGSILTRPAWAYNGLARKRLQSLGPGRKLHACFEFALGRKTMEENRASMASISWTKEFPGAITICDAAGVILEMNDQAAKAFAKDGGRALVGTNLLDCHPEPSRTKLQDLLSSGRINVYTIEKGGTKTLVYQAPWYEDGQYRGLVEVALTLPETLPHFVRDAPP